MCLLHDESPIRRVAPALQGPKSRGGMLENQHSIVPQKLKVQCVCVYIYTLYYIYIYIYIYVDLNQGQYPPESDHFSENGGLPR